MIAIQIKDIKNFMNHLLTDTTFDSFLLNHASITSYNNFEIDGRIHPSYYTREEFELLEQKEFSSWSKLKPICFQLVKGKHTPSRMAFTFLLSAKQIGLFISQREIDLSPEVVTSMVLNIRFEAGILTCTTGISLSVFTMDKTLEHAWDEYVRRFLTAHFDVIC